VIACCDSIRVATHEPISMSPDGSMLNTPGQSAGSEVPVGSSVQTTAVERLIKHKAKSIAFICIFGLGSKIFKNNIKK
jgi:hypothetical protein